MVCVRRQAVSSSMGTVSGLNAVIACPGMWEYTIRWLIVYGGPNIDETVVWSRNMSFSVYEVE